MPRQSSFTREELIACADYPILRESQDYDVDTVMSNSFGFGGTNASLVFQRY